MSPRTKQQSESLREVSRTRIMEAALGLFAGKGFAATSISDIAGAAGISKGLMYNYFAGKDELLEHVLQMLLGRVSEVFAPALAVTDPCKRLEALIRTSFEMLKSDPAIWKMFITLSLQLDKQSNAYAIVSSYWSNMFSNAIAIFTEMGVKNPQETAFRYGAVMDGMAVQLLMFGNERFLHFDETLEMFIKEFCSTSTKEK